MFPVRNFTQYKIALAMPSLTCGYLLQNNTFVIVNITAVLFLQKIRLMNCTAPIRGCRHYLPGICLTSNNFLKVCSSHSFDESCLA